MTVPSCLHHLMGALAVATASVAWAQSHLPDPIAPAVIGRPLEQIKPARPVRKEAAVQQAPASERVAKQAVDDRVDARTPVPDDVGKGTHFARKPLAPGAYLGSRYQALVRQYYAAHPAPAKPASWKIGEPIPPKAALSGVPDNLRSVLPQAPGHEYVQVDGEVVLVATQSRMVVDGVSRAPRADATAQASLR